MDHDIQPVGLFGRLVSPVARLLPTQRTTYTQKKRVQISMFRVGFEPTIPPVFEWAKIFHDLDRAGITWLNFIKFESKWRGQAKAAFL
jgi:hypothetical protein